MNSIGNHLASQTPYTYGIIDKTALLVAKGGDGYEKRIWREQSHTRFDFLLPNHPYRPYYEQKVEECKVEVASEAAALAGPSTGESLATATPKKGFFCRVLASLWLMFWGPIWHPEQVLLHVHVAFPSGHGETLSLPQNSTVGDLKVLVQKSFRQGFLKLVTEKGFWQVLRTLCSLRKFKKERT